MENELFHKFKSPEGYEDDRGTYSVESELGNEDDRGIYSVESELGNVVTIIQITMRDPTACRVFFPTSCANLQVGPLQGKLFFLLLQ